MTLPQRNDDLPVRAILLVCGMTTLVAALAAGLARLGWNLSFLPAHLPDQHGTMMVSGFLGTSSGSWACPCLSLSFCGEDS